MTFKSGLQSLFRLSCKPWYDRLARHLHGSIQELNQDHRDGWFSVNLVSAARSLAASGDHLIRLPMQSELSRLNARDLKIGFFNNIANNAYNFVKSLRQGGFQAELVVEDGLFDAFLLNRPFWEDMDVECQSYEEGLASESSWCQPDYVRRVHFDGNLQKRFTGRLSAIAEVQAMYKDAFGLPLAEDRAFLLAQHMGHWPCLLAMSRYDVVQLSAASMMLGPFCPKPYVVFPTGSDLYIAPFEESIFGLLIRAGYRGARHILVCEVDYPDYLARLSCTAPQTFIPLMINTEAYTPGLSEPVRDGWKKEVGGERFVLSVCRQAWQWKGNDRLIHAFARFLESGNAQWRLILQEWGPDVSKTKALIGELGIASRVLWQNLCSKPVLRKRQQAADVVADQFVMEGYGTSVLESMAAQKPVLIFPTCSRGATNFSSEPPFVSAASIDEIRLALERISNDSYRHKQADLSLQWLHECHGYKNLTDRYANVYLKALGIKPLPERAQAGDDHLSLHRLPHVA